MNSDSVPPTALGNPDDSLELADLSARDKAPDQSARTETGAPSQVADAVDAVVVVKTHVDAFVSFVAPCVKTYALTLRPWRQFAVVLVQLPDSAQDLQDRIEKNLVHFQANYLLLVTLVYAVFIALHPTYFAAVLVTICAWSVYLVRGGLDSEWKPVVGGMELTSMQRLLVLSATSVTLLFLVIGEVLLVMAGSLSCLVLCHAALNPGASASAVISRVWEV